MKKSLLTGIVIVLIALIASLVAQDSQMFVGISGGAVIISFAVAALLSGSLVSGKQMRLNFAIENPEERRQRQEKALKFILMGLPNMIAIVIYFTLVS